MIINILFFVFFKKKHFNFFQCKIVLGTNKFIIFLSIKDLKGLDKLNEQKTNN